MNKPNCEIKVSLEALYRMLRCFSYLDSDISYVAIEEGTGDLLVRLYDAKRPAKAECAMYDRVLKIDEEHVLSYTRLM